MEQVNQFVRKIIEETVNQFQAQDPAVDETNLRFALSQVGFQAVGYTRAHVAHVAEAYMEPNRFKELCRELSLEDVTDEQD